MLAPIVVPQLLSGSPIRRRLRSRWIQRQPHNWSCRQSTRLLHHRTTENRVHIRTLQRVFRHRRTGPKRRRGDNPQTISKFTIVNLYQHLCVIRAPRLHHYVRSRPLRRYVHWFMLNANGIAIRGKALNMDHFY